MKSKYQDGSPEWLLEQNIANYEGQAMAFGADAIRYQKKAEDAREMAQKFLDALRFLATTNGKDGE